MDCSGLIARVLMAHGIRAPHSSRALSRMGKAVGLRELKAGDLVFFRTRGRRISHVGMYVGDGKFVHAASHVRRVVVEKLNGGCYERRFVCARRVF
jgi:cell wall-associated NlpC family hydrolase